MMTSKRREPERKARIRDEIVVDAYGPDERAMGWYYYLEDVLQFSFAASCVAERAISPLKAGDEVEVIGMAPEQECGHEVFVMIRRERSGLAVPLSQLQPCGDVDNATRRAVEDWHYWIDQGYRF